MKIFFKLFITILFLIFITLTYLSIFGVETDKFNSQITEKIRKFDKNLEVELKEIETWFLKITDYADELEEGLEKIDWPENVKNLSLIHI